jgi:hypothetical protein
MISKEEAMRQVRAFKEKQAKGMAEASASVDAPKKRIFKVAKRAEPAAPQVDIDLTEPKRRVFKVAKVETPAAIIASPRMGIPKSEAVKQIKAFKEQEAKVSTMATKVKQRKAERLLKALVVARRAKKAAAAAAAEAAPAAAPSESVPDLAILKSEVLRVLEETISFCKKNHPDELSYDFRSENYMMLNAESPLLKSKVVSGTAKDMDFQGKGKAGVILRWNADDGVTRFRISPGKRSDYQTGKSLLEEGKKEIETATYISKTDLVLRTDAPVAAPAPPVAPKKRVVKTASAAAEARLAAAAPKQIPLVKKLTDAENDSLTRYMKSTPTDAVMIIRSDDGEVSSRNKKVLKKYYGKVDLPMPFNRTYFYHDKYRKTLIAQDQSGYHG